MKNTSSAAAAATGTVHELHAVYLMSTSIQSIRYTQPNRGEIGYLLQPLCLYLFSSFPLQVCVRFIIFIKNYLILVCDKWAGVHL